MTVISESLQVAVEQDVLFGRAGERDLLCDIYRPLAAAASKHTAVINLHGGRYTRGSKAGTRLASPLAARGYTCISASYRLADEATWPAQLEDVKTCASWVRANATDLGVESSKIVLLGHSAGGHLALISSGSQLDIAACVAFYPPAETRANPVLGSNPSEELQRSFAPINYIKAGFPPTMLLHGTADQTISVDQSLKLYTALRQVGSAVELHVVEGVTHIFDAHQNFSEASAVWIDLFLDRHVVNPRTYPSTEPPGR